MNDFLLSNLSLMPRVPYAPDRLRETLDAFLNRWSDVCRSVPSFLLSDALDYGFRQNLRIKGSVASFENVVLPFEDSDWVSFWLHQPYESRVGQSVHKAAVTDAYPEVFCLPKDRRRAGAPRRPALRARLRTWLLDDAPVYRLREWAKMRTAAGPAGSLMRDFEENESAHATHRALLAGLDARGLTPGVNFEQTLMEFPKTPTKGAFDTIVQGARVEVHLRIGSVPANG